MDTAADRRDRQPDVTVSYDAAVDVLHVLRPGGADGLEGEGLPGGVELVYAAADGTPRGLTVLGYVRNGWAGRREALADIAERHLGLSRERFLHSLPRSAA